MPLNSISDDSTPKTRTTVPKDKSTPIVYNSQQYVLAYALKDGNLLYKCSQRSCLARIKVGKDKSSVTELSQHSGHRSTPLTNTNNADGTNSPLNSAASVITTDSGGKQKTNLDDHGKHKVLRKSVSLSDADQTNSDDQNNSFVSLGSISTPNISTVLLDTAQHTRDAHHSSFTESSPNVHINASEVPDNNEVLDPHHTQLPLQSSENHEYKIKYEEVRHINSSLIDKIVEKERQIWESERCIADLRARVVELEQASSSQSAPITNSVSPAQISTTPKTARKNTSKKANKIVIAGDSHVRHLDNLLGSKGTSTWDIRCAYKGGSKLGQVTDLIEEREISPLPDDILIVFSGTNDVSHTSWNCMKSSYEEIISKYHLCKIGIMLIPARRGDHHLNPHIALMNQKIVKFLATKTVITLDPQSVLGNGDYSPDGLHLNSLGKRKICELIQCHFVKSKAGNTSGTGSGVNQRSSGTGSGVHQRAGGNQGQESHGGRRRQLGGGRGRRSADGRGRQSADGRTRRSAGGRGRQSADGRGRRSADGRGRQSADGRGRRSVDGRGRRLAGGRGRTPWDNHGHFLQYQPEYIVNPNYWMGDYPGYTYQPPHNNYDFYHDPYANYVGTYGGDGGNFFA
ncbi:hypothetical protein M8J76_013235 [Diaphorina citri]|nr:hypothetical protein M8J75_007823 [Diaphorina citri]KAI5750156.1 hypothetical protein M8J76_013235 [Diaphorina citri]KAI5753511.1 hypothetical protein M8J77_000869 [Diaphorina citri]